MSNVLVNETSLQNIANAIREKTSSTDTYKPSEMAQAILSISKNNEKLPQSHYVEAMNIIDKIRSVQKSASTITFGVVTDNHINIGGNYESLTKASFIHGVLSLGVVASLCCDFIANLGDNQWENNIDSTTAMDNINFCNSKMREVFQQTTSFRLVGNHDQSSTFGKVYENVGIFNNFDNSGVNFKRGYGYKDIEDKKLRVICLNTSDYYNATGGYGMSYEQKKWFAESLDISEKANSDSWKILLLSHIPLDFPDSDYNTTADIQAILTAYVNGSTVSIAINNSYATAENDTVTSDFNYNYSGKNNAKIIANVHGHLHNLNNGRMTGNNIIRISSANTCFKLEKSNTYGGGMYDTEVSYPKTAGTAQDTAVTFYCVDTDNNVVHSYVLGAGADRVIEDSEEPFECEVTDIAVAPRSNWDVNSEGNVYLANANTQMAVGVTTENQYGFTDRESKPIYLIPVSEKATNISVATTDTKEQTIRIRGFKKGIKVFDTGWVNDFTKHFDKMSVDYIGVGLNYVDGTSVAWGYNDSQVSVKFTN